MSKTLPPPSVGQVFGRLKIIFPLGWSRLGNRAKKHRCALVKCGCQPDNPLFAVRIQDLLCGKRKSCGCLAREAHERALKRKKQRKSLPLPRHGATATRLWRTWAGINQRCSNPNHKNWEHYGGKGVQVHEAWRGRGTFPAFRAWILENLGDHPGEGWSLDRYPDNDTGNYEPGNLRWATQEDQNRNQTSNIWVTYQGERMLQADALRLTGLAISTVNSRRWSGVPEEYWFYPPTPAGQKAPWAQ